MNKRLRKKLHRGEFQEFGVTITWQFTRSLDAHELDSFFDALIEMAVGRGLTFGGGGGPEQGSGFLCKMGRGSVSEEDRSQLAEWFGSWGPMVSATIGPQEDAWHISQPQFTSIREWIGQKAPVIVMPPVGR